MTPTDTNAHKEAIRAFINRSINLEGFDNNADLFESGIVNSLFAVQLMTFLERTYRIVVDADDLDIANFRSIDSTAAFVARKLQARAA